LQIRSLLDELSLQQRDLQSTRSELEALQLKQRFDDAQQSLVAAQRAQVQEDSISVPSS
jgi:hypothetical protein